MEIYNCILLQYSVYGVFIQNQLFFLYNMFNEAEYV